MTSFLFLFYLAVAAGGGSQSDPTTAEDTSEDDSDADMSRAIAGHPTAAADNHRLDWTTDESIALIRVVARKVRNYAVLFAHWLSTRGNIVAGVLKAPRFVSCVNAWVRKHVSFLLRANYFRDIAVSWKVPCLHVVLAMVSVLERLRALFL